MHTSANSEDAGEMLYNAPFHQGLHCFLLRKKYHLEIIICEQFRSLLYETGKKNPLVQKAK